MHLMIKDLLTRLIHPAPEPLPDDAARLALPALLVRVARSDNQYTADEKGRIDEITQARYALSASDASALRTEAEALEAEAPDTVRFSRAIKDAVPYDDRLAVIEALWKVVLADGKREQEEDALLRLVSNLLGSTDRDSALARQRVTG